MLLTISNWKDNETVYNPSILVKGRATSSLVRVIHHGIDRFRFPDQHYEVNNGWFRGLVHLEPGENTIFIQAVDGKMAHDPRYKGKAHAEVGKVYDTFARLVVTYIPLVNNRPIHLCLLVAKDLPLQFDLPKYRKDVEGNGLDLAVRKLQIGARIMQTYTLEKMRDAGYGNRTFQWAEEYTSKSLLSGELVNGNDGRLRSEVKVHIIRSSYTVAELRNPDWAQQNPKAKDGGRLFGIASDELRKYGGPFADNMSRLQAAVMFLDSTWDKKLQLIVTHAALGGGDGNLGLAIFGLQLLFLWPLYWEDVYPCFLDDTRMLKEEVANDCNECGTAWEAFTLLLGAFMHEVGHSLGLPHQVFGVMLRDYPKLHKTFVTRDNFCTRTNQEGRLVDGRTGRWGDGNPREECMWHPLDLIRYLTHDTCSIPTDVYDALFQKRLDLMPTKQRKLDLVYNGCYGGAYMAPVNNGAVFTSSGGIYAVEINIEGLARAHMLFEPKSCGGGGQAKEVLLTVEMVQRMLAPEWHDKKWDINVLCISGDIRIDDFKKWVGDVPSHTERLPGGVVWKTPGLGNGGDKLSQAIFDNLKVVAIRFYTGSALDGIEFMIGSGYSRPAPAKPGQQPMAAQGGSTVVGSSLVGNRKNEYKEFVLQPGETIAKLHIRSGGWVDGLRVETSTGRISENYGGNGGSVHTLLAPKGTSIVGVWGMMGLWVNQIGIYYA